MIDIKIRRAAEEVYDTAFENGYKRGQADMKAKAIKVAEKHINRNKILMELDKL